jgi:hypothetical protein
MLLVGYVVGISVLPNSPNNLDRRGDVTSAGVLAQAHGDAARDSAGPRWEVVTALALALVTVPLPVGWRRAWRGLWRQRPDCSTLGLSDDSRTNSMNTTRTDFGVTRCAWRSSPAPGRRVAA